MHGVYIVQEMPHEELDIIERSLKEGHWRGVGKKVGLLLRDLNHLITL